MHSTNQSYAKSQQYDLELVTRFLVFRRLTETRLNDVRDVGEFLTDNIVDLAESSKFDKIKAEEQKAFEITFQVLAKALGENSFKKYDHVKEGYYGPFLISAFEPIAMGLGYNYEKYCAETITVPDVEAVSKCLWTNEDFLSHSGSGVRASSRIPVNIPLGRQLFAK